MNNAILEVKLRRAHVYRENVAKIDGRALAVLSNRQRYIEQSAATVGKLPAHPPVPASKSLVPVEVMK